MFKKYLVLVVILVSSSYAYTATYVQGVKTLITRVDSYAYGNTAGDIRILVSQSVPGCEAGYYLTNTDEGVGQSLSVALSAFHSNAKVIIGGYSGIPWGGSSNTNYCKINAVSIIK